MLACFYASAQMPPFLQQELLEEKVRDPQVRRQLLEQLGLPISETIGGTRTNEVGDGAEPYIVIDPNDPSHLVLSYMTPGLNFPIYTSEDGGYTWSQSAFDCLAAAQSVFSGQLAGGGDPVLEYDANGRLHLTWIYLLGDFFSSNFGLFYAYSDDHGATFELLPPEEMVVQAGTLIDFDIIDRQWLAADRSSGEYSGNLYLSGAYFGNTLGSGPGEIVLVKTPDSNTFEFAANVYPGSAQYGNVEVDEDGLVHMSLFGFTDQLGTEGEVVYARSADGGTTFETLVLQQNVAHPDPNGSIVAVHNRENPAVSLAVDGDDVYVAWSAFENGAVQSYIAHSSDNGASFDAPVAFGDELLGTGFNHTMPVIAASWSRFTVGWYAVDAAGMSEFHLCESLDQLETWEVPVSVSDGITQFPQTNGLDFYGDYNTMVKQGCRSYTAWAEGSGADGPSVHVVHYDGCTGAVGVEEVSPVNAGWSIGAPYPNPAEDQVTVGIGGMRETRLEWQVYGLDGGLMEQGVTRGKSSLDIDLSRWPSGMYALTVTDGKGYRAIRRLVKR